VLREFSVPTDLSTMTYYDYIQIEGWMSLQIGSNDGKYTFNLIYRERCLIGLFTLEPSAVARAFGAPASIQYVHKETHEIFIFEHAGVVQFAWIHLEVIHDMYQAIECISQEIFPL
jgi:hypothetical protein